MKDENIEPDLVISLNPAITTLLFLIIIAVIFYISLVFRERNQLREEQRNQIVAILDAIEETVVITPVRANWGLGNEYYSEVVWSFHKTKDRYNEPPHTAKIVNGQIVEVDGKPVKEDIIFIDPPSKAPEKNIQNQQNSSPITDTVWFAQRYFYLPAFLSLCLLIVTNNGDEMKIEE